MRNLQVATANIRKELHGQAVTNAVHLAMPADVVGWQEAETGPHLAVIASLPGMATFWPGGTSGRRPKLNARNATPISWIASRFTLEYGGCRLAIPGIAKISPSRYTVWTVLKDHESGQWGWLVNVHTISGIDKHRNPVKGWRGKTRKMMWRLHMAQVRRVVAMLRRNHPHAAWGAVVGDFNWPEGKLTRGQIGVAPHYAQGPTHGRNWFDVIGTDSQVVNIWRRTHTPSDHDVLTATLGA